MRHGLFIAIFCVATLIAQDGMAEAVPVSSTSSETKAPGLYEEDDFFEVSGATIDWVSSEDTDDFKRNIVRAGAIVHYVSSHEFIALGMSRNMFRQGDWSSDVDSIVLAGRRTNRRTAEGIFGQLAVTTNTDKINWHGEGSWNHRFTDRTGMELVGSRDAVETRDALAQGIVSNFLGLSIDHALTDRLAVIGMPTYQRYSDDNAHRGFRGWLIYSLFPEWGVAADLKVQGYDSTGSSNGLYFSPDNYERAEIGLRLRRSLSGWRVIASAAAGRERIDREIEKPTWTLVANLQKVFENKVTAGFQLSHFQASNAGADAASTDEYAWTMARVFVLIPF